MTIETLTESRWMEAATFLAISLGIGLLLVAYFTPGWRALGVPGLLLLLPALIYETR